MLGDGREMRGVAQGRHLHCRGWPGRAQTFPATGFPLAVPSLPARVSAAWRCPCRELFPGLHVTCLSVLTDLTPAPVLPSLPCSLSLSAGTKE